MPDSFPHRPVAVRFACVLVALGLVAIAPPGHAESGGRCTAVRVPTDSQDLTCALDAATAGRPLRFVAVFGGSHDDTRITLDARLDDVPLVCDEGSRTSLFAEDGIVRLDCGFRIARVGSASLPPVLGVRLTVHHAQYLSSSIDVE